MPNDVYTHELRGLPGIVCTSYIFHVHGVELVLPVIKDYCN